MDGYYTTKKDMSETAPNGRSPAIKLIIAALGVVYGDIGTSPLYALRICFSEHSSIAVTQANVLGIQIEL